MTPTETLTDEQVLADPGSATVDEVLAVFGRSTADQVAAAQAVEASGQKRKGVADYAPPAPPADDPPAASDDGPVERFDLARVLGPDGPRISGVPAHTLAGALHGETRLTLTRDQIAAKVEAFYKRPVTQEA